MFRMLSLAAIVVLSAAHCFANNSYFIPGDAFFYFEVDQAEWKALQKGEFTVADYDRPEEMGFTFCGYAGFKKLDLSALTPEHRDRLIKAIALMKESYPTKIVEIDHGKAEFLLSPSGIEKKETNKIRVFVYNASHDFLRNRIALKYNESWAETGVKMGFDRDHFRFDFFVPTPQGMAESWRNGSTVEAFNPILPASSKDSLTTPMKIKSSEVAFLICPPVALTALCFPPRDAELKCYVVSEDKTLTLVNDRGKSRKFIWVESK